MCRKVTGILVAIAALTLPSGGSGAGDGSRLASAHTPSPPQRIAAVSGGAATHARKDLERAAERGGPKARLNLARRYAAGDGVPHSQSRAFDLYKRIVDDHADTRASDADAHHVAQAFVALGNYYRSGIPDGSVTANKRRAFALIWHAASYLGDAEAQCTLAQMFLDGEGIARNGRLAVNWLTNAAKKRHAKAQAILGDLLMRGEPDIRRQPRKGLALLILARQNAGTEKQALWIDGLLAGAGRQSTADERDGAAKLVAAWEPHIGHQGEPAAGGRQASAHANPAALAPASSKGGLIKVGVEDTAAQR